MKFARFLTAMALLVLLSTCLLTAARAEEELGRPLGFRRTRPTLGASTSGKHRHHRHHSLSAEDDMCRTVLRSCRNATNTFDCLREAKVTGPQCSAFVGGVLACYNESHSAEGCESVTKLRDVRRCMRTLATAGRLSEECKTSHFARSLGLGGHRLGSNATAEE